MPKTRFMQTVLAAKVLKQLHNSLIQRCLIICSSSIITGAVVVGRVSLLSEVECDTVTADIKPVINKSSVITTIPVKMQTIINILLSSKSIFTINPGPL